VKFNGQHPRLSLAQPSWGYSVTIPSVEADVNWGVMHVPVRRVPLAKVAIAVGLEVVICCAEELDVDAKVDVVVLTTCQVLATDREAVSATPPSFVLADKYNFNGIHFSSEVMVEMVENVPLVDVDGDVDVDEAVIALKVIVTPAL
jgi:hypothetical protein